MSGDGAGVNAVSIAELCVGDAQPDTVLERVRTWGVDVVDVPAVAAEVMGWVIATVDEGRSS